MNRQSIISVLKSLKPKMHDDYKVSGVSLFGSFARGEERQHSDIDILVDFAADADLFSMIGLAQYLEEELGRHVDLVSVNGLRDDIKSNILKDTVSL